MIGRGEPPMRYGEIASQFVPYAELASRFDGYLVSHKDTLEARNKLLCDDWVPIGSPKGEYGVYSKTVTTSKSSFTLMIEFGRTKRGVGIMQTININHH
ncbi:hypothetical protein BpsS140_00043 [Bacillus phage vB_BpsS-140]|nr:hypothetical protein BpsS140_00043 [Bacillus phage vB_BpsS-140]